MAAAGISFYFSGDRLTEAYRLLAGLLFGVLCLLYPRIGVFTRYRPPAASLVFVTAAWSVALLAVLGFVYVLGISIKLNQSFLIVFLSLIHI